MRNALPDGDAGDSLRGLAYGNGTFVAVGYSDTLTSPDGITWTPRPLAALSVTYGNGIFAGVGGSSHNLDLARRNIMGSRETQHSAHIYCILGV